MNRNINLLAASDRWFGDVSNENRTLLVWGEVLLSVGIVSVLMDSILSPRLSEACQLGQLVQCIVGLLFVVRLGWILLCRHVIPWRLLDYIPNSQRGGVRASDEIGRSWNRCRSNQWRSQNVRESVSSTFDLIRQRWRLMRNNWSAENVSDSSCLELPGRRQDYRRHSSELLDPLVPLAPEGHSMDRQVFDEAETERDKAA